MPAWFLAFLLAFLLSCLLACYPGRTRAGERGASVKDVLQAMDGFLDSELALGLQV